MESTISVVQPSPVVNRKTMKALMLEHEEALMRGDVGNPRFEHLVVALMRPLESGAPYALCKVSDCGNRVLCHLQGTGESVWVDCDPNGEPLEPPRFMHVRALTSEALCSIVNAHRRMINLAKVRQGPWPTQHHSDLRNRAQAELERRFPDALEDM